MDWAFEQSPDCIKIMGTAGDLHHSAGKGCGSEFVVTLPLLAGGTEAAPSAGSPDAAPAVPKLRLLIVDDNRDAAETLGMYLEATGHEIHVAFSGDEALTRAATLCPDAFLLDVGLPDMTGYELARRLHAMPQTRGASMIAITGYGSQSDREHSSTAGIHHHLTKPVDTAELHELLANIAQQSCA